MNAPQHLHRSSAMGSRLIRSAMPATAGLLVYFSFFRMQVLMCEDVTILDNGRLAHERLRSLAASPVHFLPRVTFLWYEKPRLSTFVRGSVDLVEK